MTWWVWLIVIIFVVGIFGKGEEEKKRQQAANEAEKRRKEAEDYIMNSGDPEAIKAMMLARANPVGQGQISNATQSSGNSALKTAAGVVAGVVVGEAVASTVAAAAVSHVLDDAVKSSWDTGGVSDLFD